MGRLEEAIRVAEELLADVELKRLKASEIVSKASRLARLVGHDDLQTFLAYERDGYPVDGSANQWISRAGRWIGPEAEATSFYSVPISKIDATLSASEQALRTLTGGGNYSGEYASIAAREHDDKITSHTLNVQAMAGLAGQVVATIYDMVVEIYHELLFSELQATLFADTQATVDGALATAGGSALNKIERVSDRLRDGDPESVSQALTTCRRLIDSTADYVFPAQEGEYDIGEGNSLRTGSQQVLNRLQAYTHSLGLSKSRRDRLRLTMREIYGRCSAGTHAEVTVQEARFLFLQTYIVLGEILTLERPDVVGGVTNTDEPEA